MRIWWCGKITDRKVVVVLVAGMRRFGRLARRAHGTGGGGTVVAVGDVQRRHGVEQLGEAANAAGVADHPQGVAHPFTPRNTVGVGRLLGRRGDDRCHLRAACG
jgi:hypothetical protein